MQYAGAIHDYEKGDKKQYAMHRMRAKLKNKEQRYTTAHDGMEGHQQKCTATHLKFRDILI